MFGKRFTLFKIFGFQVWIDFSWLILGLLITWSLASGLFPQTVRGLTATTYWLMGVAGPRGRSETSPGPARSRTRSAPRKTRSRPFRS